MFHTHNQWDKVFRLRILLSIVLGLMIVYPVARSAAARQMLSCKLSAVYDLTPRVIMPGQPDTSPRRPFVAGTCTFPTPGFSVELKAHTPQSPDPRILVLDAIVHAPTNSVPQVPTDVSVRYPLPGSSATTMNPKTGTLYEEVIILPDNMVLTVSKLS